MQDKPNVKIEQWIYTSSGMYGKAYNHPRFDDGTDIRTSFIVNAPEKPKEGDVVETNNTMYTLGKPYGE